MRTHVDICSGIGGFAIAARRAGLETIQFCEIEPFCQAVLRKNFEGVPVHGDLRTFNAKSFRGRVFLLTAGFPCQDISAAGKGAGLAGKKSSLWWQVRRVVRECRPLFCLIENVNMLFHRGIDTVLFGLERAGYACASFVVGACDVGAPHQRKRVWIVAYRRDTVGVSHANCAWDSGKDAEIPTGRNAAIGSRDAMADAQCERLAPERRRGAKLCDGSSVPSGLTVTDSSELADAGYLDAQRRNEAEARSKGRSRGKPASSSSDVADADTAERKEPRKRKSDPAKDAAIGRGCEDVANSIERQEFDPGDDASRQSCLDGQCANVAHSNTATYRGPEQPQSHGQGVRSVTDSRDRIPRFPPTRNAFEAWAEVARLDATLMPSVEREVRDMANGVSTGLVRRRRIAKRNATLKALGNSIVPEVAFQFIKAILECEHVIESNVA